MAPTFNPDDPAIASLISSFKALGLPEAKAVEAAKSPKNAASLKALIDQADLTKANLDEKKAFLILSLSIAASKLDDDARLHVAGAVVDGRLKSAEQLSGEPPDFG